MKITTKIIRKQTYQDHAMHTYLSRNACKCIQTFLKGILEMKIDIIYYRPNI